MRTRQKRWLDSSGKFYGQMEDEANGNRTRRGSSDWIQRRAALRAAADADEGTIQIPDSCQAACCGPEGRAPGLLRFFVRAWNLRLGFRSG